MVKPVVIFFIIKLIVRFLVSRQPDMKAGFIQLSLTYRSNEKISLLIILRNLHIRGLKR
jgi:hypothetical protein